MRNKHLGVRRLIVIGIGVLVMTQWNVTPAAAQDDGPPCRFEGAWFWRDGENWIHETATSLDPANKRVAVVSDWNVAELDFGLGLGATKLRTAQGESVRTSPRSFRFRFVGYGIGPNALPR